VLRVCRLAVPEFLVDAKHGSSGPMCSESVDEQMPEFLVAKHGISGPMCSESAKFEAAKFEELTWLKNVLYFDAAKKFPGYMILRHLKGYSVPHC
jgi:hypothetical protein